mmetsp:Transcript_29492/g.43557  ORF Transcript_29492/g.43557 Transcript_29492/m.43557 type:complete len:497 (+) Transcript_29492:175-1665(+)
MKFSTIESSLPDIKNVVQCLRCGAITKSAAVVSSVIPQTEDAGMFGLPPKAQSIIFMAVAMSLHYFGYSLARPSTIAIFTSSKTGYTSTAAFPLAMAFVSPVSLLLLISYTKALDNYGPRGALAASTLGSASILFMAAMSILMLQNSDISFLGIPLIKYVAGPLFVFRESYVQLITSQYWSFMSSVLNPEQSSRWFAPISGLTSITSAVAGMNVSLIVSKLGLAGAIFGTGFMMVLSLIAASRAYAISDKFGFNPSHEESGEKSKVSKSQVTQHDGLLTKASKLFRRVPTLWALFLEVLASQGLAALLNVIFVAKLSSAIPNDQDRAGWMGKFFALINVITMVLQFGLLPNLMQVLEPKFLWRVLPIIMIGITATQSMKFDPSLSVVAASLLTMKTLEYSARRMLDEMVYVPLDFESRYVGKEVVGVLAYRLGKSGMSLSLSALTALFGNFGLQELSLLATGASVLWCKTTWDLSNLVPTKQEASILYKNKSKGNL